jgi:phenylalanyl-tRNA synthetase beta chain
VGAATRDVVLEAAVFKRERVRRSSRRLGLRSESSLRFERGVNAHGTLAALKRAASLLESLAGGKASAPLQAGALPALPAALPLLPERVNALLGTALEQGQMAGLLEQRGFSLSRQGSGWSAQAPAWRPDLHHAQDLAEEVLQMLGLEKVAATALPEVRTPDPDDNAWVVGLKLRELCARQGLREASTYSYLDPALAEAWQLEALKLDNPLSAEQSLLRPSLLPNLVDCASQSLRRKAPGLAYFELGHVFAPGKGQADEMERLAVVLAGRRLSATWLSPAKDWDYYDLKGMAERLAEDLGVAFRIHPIQPGKAPGWMHPGQAAELSMGGLNGWLGALHPALLRRLDIQAPLFALELEGLGTKSMLKEPRYEAVSRFPSVERDLSCLMPLGLEAGKVLDFLRTEGGLKGVGVKDRFEGAPLPEGKKSLTFSITYSADGRSLTDEEVNKLHDEICRRLETALPLEVRR